MPAVEQLLARTDRLEVRWDDGVTSEHLWLWLRENSHDPTTLHPDTFQRQVVTSELDPAIRADDVRVDGAHVVVRWVGGTTDSTLPIRFLAEHRGTDDPDELDDLDDARVLWDGRSILGQWPEVTHDEVMRDDAGVARWLDLVARFGFCMVTGTPPSTAATEALLRRVGYVRETIFGGMWDFRADLSRADTAYTALELRPHTDGTYSQDAPGLQLLHCLEFDGTGGESTMVDGFRVAAQLRVADPEAYELLSTVPVTGRYLGDGVHLRAARPILRHDAAGLLVQVSFNDADRAPMRLPPDELAGFYDAMRSFDRQVNDVRLQWRRPLRAGDAMLFDNWRVLHGRLSYTGHRHLAGGYLNREDFLSRRRMLRPTAD